MINGNLNVGLVAMHNVAHDAVSYKHKTSRYSSGVEPHSDYCMDLNNMHFSEGKHKENKKFVSPDRKNKRSSSLPKSFSRLRIGASNTLGRPQHKSTTKHKSEPMYNPVQWISPSEVSLSSLAELQRSIHTTNNLKGTKSDIRKVQGVVSYSCDAYGVWDPASNISLEEVDECNEVCRDDDGCVCNCDYGESGGACDHILDLQDALISVAASMNFFDQRFRGSNSARSLNSRATDCLQLYRT
ncbi:hypothetical protein SARC_05476 [Sphaeroforma arctica JP610]|uniref:Uncharacterized protein n=1 Tax=Sphaeroforma arctica JP610 TaxID=667725 RepID=A0A0L0G055_9EUKA|nr:hypothetical protein SARC_05476 [Sphaeroforma arctica JP610]KNC82234.1 hypothetical protein SARC_05476 [Sphaeroforma arctica JP610]|eukprot:XP_014156136.1 hypothetical protein SARC_05476 [Sphaeroforma arctica JP610]